jgi:hypothetical protein
MVGLSFNPSAEVHKTNIQESKEYEAVINAIAASVGTTLKNI